MQSQILYLASESPRRREILKKMRIKFVKVVSSYKEKNKRVFLPSKLVLEHAKGKAACAILPKNARFVLAADTIVWRDGCVIGKPKNLKQAHKILFFLSGKRHFVYTGVVLEDRSREMSYSGVAITKVYFKKLTQNDIKKYTSKVCPFDKAGAYAIQEGPKVVKKIQGSYTNVMGLPAELVKKLLKRAMQT